jgi:hypothetical protein
VLARAGSSGGSTAGSTAGSTGMYDKFDCYIQVLELFQD